MSIFGLTCYEIRRLLFWKMISKLQINPNKWIILCNLKKCMFLFNISKYSTKIIIIIREVIYIRTHIRFGFLFITYTAKTKLIQKAFNLFPWQRLKICFLLHQNKCKTSIFWLMFQAKQKNWNINLTLLLI